MTSNISYLLKNIFTFSTSELSSQSWNAITYIFLSCAVEYFETIDCHKVSHAAVLMRMCNFRLFLSSLYIAPTKSLHFNCQVKIRV